MMLLCKDKQKSDRSKICRIKYHVNVFFISLDFWSSHIFVVFLHIYGEAMATIALLLVKN